MKKYVKTHSLCHSSKANQRGLALLSVLWITALLGFFVLSMISLLRSETVIAYAGLDEAQAEAWANAAVFLTIHDLCDIHLARNIPVDGSSKAVHITNQDITVSVQDENGKIDINFAPLELLKSLLKNAGIEDNNGVEIATAINKKRETTFKTAADSGDDFSSAVPKLPFRSIDELKSISGITDELFKRLQPALTVYSQQSTLFVPTAPKEALLSLPEMEADNIRAVLTARQQRPITMSDISLIQGSSSQENLAGRAFAIIATTHVNNAAFSRRAVVRITGDSHRPYGILDWSYGG